MLSNIPWEWKVVLTIVICIMAVIVSIYGKLGIQRDKFKIFLGNGSKKRSCKDCLMMQRNIIRKAEKRVKQLEDSLKARQINFAKQKLLAIQNSIVNKYIDYIDSLCNKDIAGESSIQFRMYNGVVSDAIETVKTEIRRALMENGFCEMDNKEFISYTNNEANVCIEMLKKNIRIFYPPPNSPLIVPEEVLHDNIESLRQNISASIFEIFNNAKNVHIDVEKLISEVDKDCDMECDKLVFSATA